MSKYETDELISRLEIGFCMAAMPALLLTQMIDSFIEIFSPFFILVISVLIGMSLILHSTFHLFYKAKMKLFKSS